MICQTPHAKGFRHGSVEHGNDTRSSEGGKPKTKERGKATDEVQIFVKALTSKTILLRAKPWNTVKEMKMMIGKTEKVPWDKQRLMCNGKQLEDSRTISDYDIKENDCAHDAKSKRRNGSTT